MALVYRAELSPTKLELLAAWLPGRDWYQAEAGAELVRVSAFRFDDPADAVGIETLLVRAGDGPVYQVPLTYRHAPLAGADAWLIGTSEHSVLGRRWVYDACGDPVYATALATAILTGGVEAEEYVDTDGRPVRRDPLMTVAGSGTRGTAVPSVEAVRKVVDADPTLIVTDTAELTVLRRLDTSTTPPSTAQPSTAQPSPAPIGVAAGVAPGQGTLTGSWAGLAAPRVLAFAAPR